MTGSARGFSFCGSNSGGFRFELREGFGFAAAVTKRNVRKKKTELQEQGRPFANLYEAQMYASCRSSAARFLTRLSKLKQLRGGILCEQRSPNNWEPNEPEKPKPTSLLLVPGFA
jgi:hypothetical protein